MNLLHRSLLALALTTAIPGSATAAPARTGGPTEGSGIYLEPNVGDAHGLSKFSMKSTSGALRIAQLGVMLGLDHVAGWFSGRLASQAIDLDFVHNRLPPGAEVRIATRRSCSNDCVIGIPKATKGQVLVLSGFSFDTRGGAETPVRRLAVTPDPAEGTVTFSLHGPRDVEFDAVLQYAYIPASSVVQGRVFSRSKVNLTGGKRTKLVYPELRDGTGAPLLHGFSLEFGSASNELEVLAISLIRDAAVVLFNDESGDDAYTATVDVVRLRD